MGRTNLIGSAAHMIPCTSRAVQAKQAKPSARAAGPDAQANTGCRACVAAAIGNASGPPGARRKPEAPRESSRRDGYCGTASGERRGGRRARNACARGILEPRQFESLQTAVNYQLFNSLGLLAMGISMRQETSRWLSLIAALLIGGIVLFSGSIYLMLAGAPWPTALLTPMGGVLLITSWTFFGITLLRKSVV